MHRKHKKSRKRRKRPEKMLIIINIRTKKSNGELGLIKKTERVLIPYLRGKVKLHMPLKFNYKKAH